MITFSNGVIVAAFDEASGNLLSVKSIASGVSMPLTHVPMQYVNGTGGAYILAEDFEALPVGPPSTYTLQSGPLFDQLCQQFELQVLTVILPRHTHTHSPRACTSPLWAFTS